MVLSQDAIFEVRDGVGSITLNRPKALNAANAGMVLSARHHLKQWAHPSSGVNCVFVKGAGGKAFCAGGDVKACVQAAASGNAQLPIQFFETEYAMDAEIAALNRPYISLIDGIVMGGGVGLSVHGHFRVATERTVLAMPECAIGLFPDVGASFFLNRLPGFLGLYMALTGARLTGSTVYEAGLATHFLPSSAASLVEPRIRALSAASSPPHSSSSLLSSFSPASSSASKGTRGEAGCERGTHGERVDWAGIELGEVNRVLEGLQSEAGAIPQGDLHRLLPVVNLYFGHETLIEILTSLEQVASAIQGQRHGIAQQSPSPQEQQQQGMGARTQDTTKAKQESVQAPSDSYHSQFVLDTLAALKRGSPLSLAITFHLMKRARQQQAPLTTCLAADCALVHKFVRGMGDFDEGVTAMLIDRGRTPSWKYQTVQEVPMEVVEIFFEGGPFAAQQIEVPLGKEASDHKTHTAHMLIPSPRL